MISTSSQYSRRSARYWSRERHLDRLLDSDTYGTVEQRRIVDVAEALRLASVRTGLNMTLNREEISR